MVITSTRLVLGFAVVALYFFVTLSPIQRPHSSQLFRTAFMSSSSPAKHLGDASSSLSSLVSSSKGKTAASGSGKAASSSGDKTNSRACAGCPQFPSSRFANSSTTISIQVRQDCIGLFCRLAMFAVGSHIATLVRCRLVTDMPELAHANWVLHALPSLAEFFDLVVAHDCVQPPFGIHYGEMGSGTVSAHIPVGSSCSDFTATLEKSIGVVKSSTQLAISPSRALWYEDVCPGNNVQNDPEVIRRYPLKAKYLDAGIAAIRSKMKREFVGLHLRVESDMGDQSRATRPGFHSEDVNLAALEECIVQRALRLCESQPAAWCKEYPLDVYVVSQFQTFSTSGWRNWKADTKRLRLITKADLTWPAPFNDGWNQASGNFDAGAALEASVVIKSSLFLGFQDSRLSNYTNFMRGTLDFYDNCPNIWSATDAQLGL